MAAPVPPFHFQRTPTASASLLLVVLARTSFRTSGCLFPILSYLLYKRELTKSKQKHLYVWQPDECCPHTCQSIKACIYNLINRYSKIMKMSYCFHTFGGQRPEERRRKGGRLAKCQPRRSSSVWETWRHTFFFLSMVFYSTLLQCRYLAIALLILEINGAARM